MNLKFLISKASYSNKAFLFADLDFLYLFLKLFYFFFI